MRAELDLTDDFLLQFEEQRRRLEAGGPPTAASADTGELLALRRRVQELTAELAAEAGRRGQLERAYAERDAAQAKELQSLRTLLDSARGLARDVERLRTQNRQQHEQHRAMKPILAEVESLRTKNRELTEALDAKKAESPAQPPPEWLSARVRALEADLTAVRERLRETVTTFEQDLVRERARREDAAARLALALRELDTLRARVERLSSSGPRG